MELLVWPAIRSRNEAREFSIVLEALDELDELEALDELDELEALDELDELEALDELDELEALDVAACSWSNVARTPLARTDCPPVSALDALDVVEAELVLVAESLVCAVSLACAAANCRCCNSCCWETVLLLMAKDIESLQAQQRDEAATAAEIPLRIDSFMLSMQARIAPDFIRQKYQHFQCNIETPPTGTTASGKNLPPVQAKIALTSTRIHAMPPASAGSRATRRGRPIAWGFTGAPHAIDRTLLSRMRLVVSKCAFRRAAARSAERVSTASTIS
ncbi:hypothetical protein [Telmatospirillum sp.]|uniref:hypothetical protein n=1 Tax=Telmatospirillum sp. TaxID=2079197 RepID=UPI002841F9A1|nr:hypothetical protein [Telmatospirillum sp.]MDR3439575.1 hypothetical protein [Telmatospirillum sp.]